MSTLARFKTALRRFRRDESGSAAVETAMMAPLLAWAFTTTMVYFDAYRSEAIATKAATTVSDMLSREVGFINSGYLNGMQDVLDFLSKSATVPDFRLTVLTWDDTDTEYKVRWSRKRGTRPVLDTATLNSLVAQLPVLVDGERAILLETWTSYSPAFAVGLNDFEFENFMVVSPRFATQLCWNNDANEDPARSKC